MPRWLIAGWVLLMAGAVAYWVLQNDAVDEVAALLPSPVELIATPPAPATEEPDFEKAPAPFGTSEWFLDAPEDSDDGTFVVLVLDLAGAPVPGLDVVAKKKPVLEVVPAWGMTTHEQLSREITAWAGAVGAVQQNDDVEVDGPDLVGRTDAAGKARFEGVLPGAYVIRLSRGGEVVLRRAGDDLGGRFVLAPMQRVTGRVVDDEGTPAARADVTLRSDGGGWAQVRTDEAGRFAASLSVGPDMRVTADVKWTDVGRGGAVARLGQPLEVELIQLRSVRGVVVFDFDTPVRNTLVYSGVHETRTNAKGEFRLSGLGPLDRSVVAEYGDFEMSKAVPEGDGELFFDFVLPEDGKDR